MNLFSASTNRKFLHNDSLLFKIVPKFKELRKNFIYLYHSFFLFHIYMKITREFCSRIKLYNFSISETVIYSFSSWWFSKHLLREIVDLYVYVCLFSGSCLCLCISSAPSVITCSINIDYHVLTFVAEYWFSLWKRNY